MITVIAHRLEARRSDRVLVVLVFAVACGLIFTRRPDSVLQAQFFAEDGAWWFAQAHDLGLRSLFIAYRDYWHFAPRIAAWISLAAPLERAPLVLNVIAIAIQALPAAFLASSRMARAIPSARIRVALGLLYVSLPNIWGTISTVTDSQWHLAVLACLVVLGTPSRHPFWRTFDAVAVAVSGLSGPFAIFLVPVAALTWYVRRERRLLTLGGIIAVAAGVQCCVIIRATEAGAWPPYGGVVALLRAVVGRVVYGLTIGQTGYERLFAHSTFWMRPPVLVMVATALAVLVGYALLRGSLELKMFWLYAGLVLAAALLFPSKERLTVPFWDNLAAPAASNRYFLIPMYALAIALVWLAASPSLLPRTFGTAVLVVMAVLGVARDWREPPPLDYDYARFVAKYNRAPLGARVQIPYPPGWSMVLTKR